MLTEITRKLDSGRCAVRLKKASKVTEISIHKTYLLGFLLIIIAAYGLFKDILCFKTFSTISCG